MNRLTKIDRCGHYYTNNANCCNIRSKEGGCFEGVYFKDDVLVIDGETIQKLGKLEDLEEELGCPLEVVFKAMTMGIMLKNSDEFWEHNYSDFDDKYVYFSTEEISLKNWQCHGIDNVTNSFQINFGDDNEFCVYLKDYGKRWWIKGEKDE